MHNHLELIMPPTKDVEAAVEQVLKEYHENYKDEDGHETHYGFYDYYVIGGRWAGTKLIAILGKEKVRAFEALLAEKKVTVSGFVAGKETLQPAEQIQMVDDLWNEHFPDSPVKQCPLFSHYEENYGDILELGQVPKNLTAGHVIICKPHWQDEGFLDAGYMLMDEIWNGVTFQDTKWDGNVLGAIEEYTKRLDSYKEDYQKKCTPQPDWLCITIDYHH